MTKKSVFIIALVAVAFLLSGCNKEMDKVDDFNATEQSIFQVVEERYNGIILVDSETHVMYWMSYSSYNVGTLTLLVDEYGNPKIYKGQ